MTLEEAKLAGQLVKAHKDLRREMRGLAEVKGNEIAFDEELYLPREVFEAMLAAGMDCVTAELRRLGVDVP